jgi:UDP-glucose 4-epimerase
MRNVIVVIGGAGFIGSNLIEELIKFNKYKILSVDNYSSGTILNHIKNPKVKYLKGHSKSIAIILKKYRRNIISIFHFGEFARISQSFKNYKKCFESNIIGTTRVFDFALENKIKIIYSATSASLGNNGKDMNLSPYAFTKAKNLELLENLKKWYNLNCEIIYFYNVYGPGQVCKGEMATIVGIFEEHFKNRKPLPIVRPGSQTRRFTHVKDTVAGCVIAWKRNKSAHYAISNKKSYSIIQLAKMFNFKIKYLPKRLGERFSSAVIKKNLGNKIINIKARTSLESYIKNFLNQNS